MSKIDIAMATYNGEEFISEQIVSIQKQSFSEWTLYISDDFSTDNTRKIIEDLAANDNRIKLINTDRQGGVVANFNKALEATNSQYIALADQDDYWPKDRLKILFDKILEEENQAKPLMIFSDLILVNKDLKTISDSLYKSRKLDPYENMDYFDLLWKCSVYGCSTLMNRALLEKSLPIPADATMHDNWLALNAATENGLKYLDEVTILYRQHDKNVVGGKANSFVDKIITFKTSLKKMIKFKAKVLAMLSSAKKIKGNENLDTIKLEYPHSILFAFQKVLPVFKDKGRKGYALLFLLTLMVNK